MARPLTNMLKCSICNDEKPIHHFHKNNKSSRGYDSRCIPCKKVKRDLERQTDEYRQWDAVRLALWKLNNPEKYSLLLNRRRTKEDEQIASWTKDNPEELRAIAAIYKQAKTLREAYEFDFHVDHIVPLNSKFVCGFTCLSNMEPLSASANSSKGNHWWPGMQIDLDYDQIVRDSENALERLKKSREPHEENPGQRGTCSML